MKRKLWIMPALTVLLALLCCGAAMAEVTTGQCGDNVTWSFDSATGVVTVTGTGPMQNYYPLSDINTSPFKSDQSVTSAVIGEGITGIGVRFFYDCRNLASVSLPSTLELIGWGAFYGNGLETLTIPEGVTYIGNYAFANNPSLTELTLPDSVTGLGYDCFSGCTGLTDAVLSKGLTEIPDSAFYGCSALTDVTIPADVTSIADRAFASCASLTTIHGKAGSYAETYAAAKGYAFAPTGTATAGGACGMGVSWALYDDGLLFVSGEGNMDPYSGSAHAPWYDIRSSITSVSIWDGVTSVGSYAFCNCYNLASVRIPEGVEDLGDSAFRECTNLESAVIPKTVDYISGHAFYDCSSLTSITISSVTATFGSDVFTGCPAGMVMHGFEGSPANVYADGQGIMFDAWQRTESGSCGENVTWSVDKATGVVTVTGAGPMRDYDCYDSSNYSPFESDQSVTSAVIGEGVTGIGAWFFDDCHNLTSVSLPSTLKRIERGAFYGNGLAALTIPEGVTYIDAYAFDNNPSLTDLTLPDSVAGLGIYSFSSCTGLINAVLPKGLTEIPENAFSGCSALTDVTIPFDVTSIADNAFSNCVNLTTIHGVQGSYAETYAAAEGYAFAPTVMITAGGACGMGVSWTLYDDGLLIVSGEGSMDPYSGSTHAPWYDIRSSITSVIIRDGVTSVGSYAFCNCYNLASVRIPEGVEDLGGSAFRNCMSLESAVIPKTVNYIPGYAFYDCSSLTSVTISSVTATFGSDVFTGCPTELVMHGYDRSPANVYADEQGITFDPWSSTEIGSCGNGVTWMLDYITGVLTISGTGAMEGYQYSDNMPWYMSRQSIISVVIENGVTSIGNSAFCECTNLTSVSIPNSVASIGVFAFPETGLTDLTIPGSVTSIGIGAFQNCTNLTSVILSEGVTEIQDFAFARCSALTDVTIPVSMGSIGNNAFMDCDSLTIHGIPGFYAETFAAAEGYAFAPTVMITAGGACGTGVSWTLYDDGLLVVSGEGGMDPYSGSTHAPWYDIRSSITSVIIQDGVTSVGSYAFYYCYKLTSASIPGSVKTVNSCAFQECRQLTEVNIAEGVENLGVSVFRKCMSLESAVIPKTVNYIPNYAFYGCSSLTSVTISSITATFGIDVFAGCPAGLVMHGYDGSPANVYADEQGVSFDPWPSTETGSCGDSVTWTLDHRTCRLTISGTGQMTDYSYSEEIPWYGYKENIASAVIEEGVTSIGTGAFYGCSGLKDVSISSGVRSIGFSAFSGCSGLTDVMIPDSVTSIEGSAFSGCSGLTDVMIPGSVTSIGYMAFRDCSGLTSVTILNSGAAVGDSDLDVFLYCPSTMILCGWTGSTAEAYAGSAGIDFRPLTGGSCGDGLTWVFADDTLTISGTGSMDDFLGGEENQPWHAYMGDIESVMIGPGVASVGNAAFGNACILTNVSLPSGLTRIGAGAFEGSAVQSVLLPSGLTAIGENAFRECTGLTTISIPGGVQSIGVSAFEGCSGLSALTIQDGVASIGDHAFENCAGLTGVILPGSVASIGYEAFREDTGLTSVTILNRTAVIDDTAFCGCVGLTLRGYPGSTAEAFAGQEGIPFDPLCPEPDFYLPAGLTAIGEDAFRGIAAQAVVIPAGVTAIEGDPFAGSEVVAVYGYDDTWKTWAEEKGYIFVLFDGE